MFFPLQDFRPSGHLQVHDFYCSLHSLLSECKGKLSMDEYFKYKEMKISKVFVCKNQKNQFQLPEAIGNVLAHVTAKSRVGSASVLT